MCLFKVISCLLMPGMHYADVDECKIGAHNCSNKEICVDKEGSFVCECKKEYEVQPDGSCRGIIKLNVYKLVINTIPDNCE